MLIGTGANGKSTYLNMLKHLLGQKNTSSLGLKNLDEKFATVMMFGKLANIGDDISDKMVNDLSYFKIFFCKFTIKRYNY